MKIETEMELIKDHIHELRDQNSQLVDKINAVEDLISFAVTDHINNYHL